MNGERRKSRPLTVSSNNSQFLSKRFARRCKLHIYPLLVYFRKFLSSADKEVENRILAKRCEILNTEGKDRYDLRIRNLELFCRGVCVPVINVPSWLKNIECLLFICQPIRSMDCREFDFQIFALSESSVVFFRESWLSTEKQNSEMFLASVLQFNARKSWQIFARK